MAKKRFARARKGNRKNTNSVLIWGMIVLIISAVGAGLFFLKSNSNYPKIKRVDVKKDLSQPQLPPPPEERWSYIKALETRTINTESNALSTNVHANTTVKTPNVTTHKTESQKENTKPQSVWAALDQNKVSSNANTTTTNQTQNHTAIAQNKGQFGLQCGAFDKLEQAEAQRAKLAMLGMTAYVKRTNNWNRVFVGPIGSRDQAQEVRERIHSQIDCFVIGM